jgi:glycolate oxidase
VLERIRALERRSGLRIGNVFHAGDGNLHPLLSFDRSDPGVLERVLRSSEEIVRLCVDAGGSLSGEHGIGLEKRDFMPLVFSDDDLAAQACVRSAFDPSGRMNPRKVLPDGARCGDFAVAASATDASGVADAAAAIPEGTWI